MPIIRFEFNRDRVPADAVNVRVQKDGDREIYLYDTHVGLCIYDFERNGYDDSDFLMVVWNPELKKPEQICFASTRGWSYPAYDSKPDATPEVLEEYHAYNKACLRRNEIQNRWKRRISDTKIAQELKLKSRKDAIRLRDALGGSFVYWDDKGRLIFKNAFNKNPRHQRFLRICNMMKKPEHKSAFRNSIVQQIRAWIDDPNPQYPTPLSKKQLELL
jgi:hypothetical protein